MLRKLVSLSLYLSGRTLAMRFVKSIFRLGTRDKVIGSNLLFDQGLWVMLSGANTTAAMQTSGRFVLPYWLERQWNPDSSSFLPSGAGLLTCNLTHRNWTSLGLPGEAAEILVDPVGMITPRIHGVSYFPYFIDDEQKIFPPLEKEFTQSFDLKMRQVVTKYFNKSEIGAESLVSVALWESDLCALVEVKISNNSQANKAVNFGLAIRPYNPLAVGHVGKLFRTTETVLETDDGIAVIALESPASIIAADRNHGDPLEFGNGIALECGESLHSESGILFANLEYQKTLLPNQSYSIRFILPVASAQPASNKAFARAVTFEEYERLQNHAQSVLFRYENESLSISLPNEKIQRQFMLSKAHTPAFDDGLGFCPGSYLYHHSWLRDGYFLMESAMNLGLWHGLEEKCRNIIKNQSSSGLFKNAPNELDGNGQALGILVDYCRKSGNESFLRECFPHIVRGSRWIYRQYKNESKRKSPHSGLLPMGFSAEHLGTIDSYFWDALWGLHGIRCALWASERIGCSTQSLELKKWESEISSGIRRCIHQTLQKFSKDILPASPYRHPDAASIACVAALDPLELDDLVEPWLSPTLEYLMHEYLKDGLFFHPIFHTGLNPYLSVQLARVLMARGDKRWFNILQSLVTHASPTGTWPEAINPLTKGGCMGDGHHGWANAEFVTLVRNAFVFEHQNNLYLGHGVPADWLTHNNGFELRVAPSRLGNVDFWAHCTNGEVTLKWNISPHALSNFGSVFVSVPFSGGRNDYAKLGSRFLFRVELNGELSLSAH